MAVAVAAKGTLVAGVVAADTVVGVAPCIMGTFGREPWKRHMGGWSVYIFCLFGWFYVTMATCGGFGGVARITATSHVTSS